MEFEQLSVHRQTVALTPDPRRVITRPFVVRSPHRIQRILKRVLDLDEAVVAETLDATLAQYVDRHRDIRRVLHDSFEEVAPYLGSEMFSDSLPTLSVERRLLIGAYFTMEYSIESAALFNPSIVLDPDQSGVPEGHARVILSLRATGEGHISSIEFRRGLIGENNLLTFEPVSRYVESAPVEPEAYYDKDLFALKLYEMSVPAEMDEKQLADFLESSALMNRVLDRLASRFTYPQLREAIAHEYAILAREQDGSETPRGRAPFDAMTWLARCNYRLHFRSDSSIAERVIFPTSEIESQGIEDARFVRFTDDDGSVSYYATYTAYNGRTALSQLLNTTDFRDFQISTLNGKQSQSKGMALFPRRIREKYAMVGRVDGENLFILFSDNIHFWHEAVPLRAPEKVWELMQIGNCGSPIETESGWLLLTHGVGPVRRYCIGAVLLDRDDPTRVIGSLESPLIEPQEDEREGYVPNVVYSCGALVHSGTLVVPYAVSDQTSRIATVPLEPLLAALTG